MILYSPCNVYCHPCFPYVVCFDVPSVFHSPVFLDLNNVVVHTISIVGKNCLRKREMEENEDSQCLTIFGPIPSGPTTLVA